MDKEALNIMKGNERPEEWQQPPVDKEAEEGIKNLVRELIPDWGEMYVEIWAAKFLKAIKQLGYQKPPEGQPLLLSEEEMQNIRFNKPSSNAPRIPSYVTVIAQVQREADIKWYGGKR